MNTNVEPSLMELFKNPDTMQSLSFGEKMQASTITMVLGLGITFLVLIIIWAMIALISKIMRSVESGSKGSAAAATPAPASKASPAAAATAPAAASAAPADEPAEDQSQLIAVIAAAVAAMEGTTVDRLVVRRINRVAGQANAWNTAGRQEVISSRRI